MTAALLAAPTSNGSRPAPAAYPIRLRREDSLRRIASPQERMSAAMAAVCVGSLALHGALLAVTIVTNRVPTLSPHQEIAVEIVQEPQKAPATPTPPVRMDAAKADAPKAPQAPATPAEPPKPAPFKQELAQAPPPPQPSRPQQPQLAKPAAAPADDAADALRKELSELKAQQAALKDEARALSSSAEGPLSDSRQALALPSSGADGGDVVGYQQIVFSQLAKAKGMDAYEGDAGTTGIRFEIDAVGGLLSEQVAVSSGKPALDAKALDIVRRAAPFPAPPKDGEHVFFANVNFRPPKRS